MSMDTCFCSHEFFVHIYDNDSIFFSFSFLGQGHISPVHKEDKCVTAESSNHATLCFSAYLG